jgi:hypothetical protein
LEKTEKNDSLGSEYVKIDIIYIIDQEDKDNDKVGKPVIWTDNACVCQIAYSLRTNGSLFKGRHLDYF